MYKQRSLAFKRLLINLALPLVLGGCSLAQETTSAYVGLGAGATAGGITGNALVGVGVGALASWGVAELFEYFAVRTRADVQAAIATAASALDTGQAAAWTGNKVAGQVEVTRVFGTMTTCKEILYSLEIVDETAIVPPDGSDREADKHYFVGTICQLGQIWQWAVPEAAAR